VDRRTSSGARRHERHMSFVSWATADLPGRRLLAALARRAPWTSTTCQQTVAVWNWASGAWETLDSRSALGSRRPRTTSRGTRTVSGSPDSGPHGVRGCVPVDPSATCPGSGEEPRGGGWAACRRPLPAGVERSRASYGSGAQTGRSASGPVPVANQGKSSPGRGRAVDKQVLLAAFAARVGERDVHGGVGLQDAELRNPVEVLLPAVPSGASAVGVEQ
jgi:hypothetical protein